MSWKIDLSNMLISGASFGGPLAIVCRDALLFQITPGNRIEKQILIYSTSGEELASIPLENCQLVGMGWTKEELLVLVREDGTVLMYDILGNFVQTFLLLLPTSSLKQSIVQICIWSSGIVALTSNMEIQACDNVSMVAPVVYSMSTGLAVTRPATAMVILEPCFTSSGFVEVIIGTSDNSVLVVDINGPEDQLLRGRIQAPVVSMAIAPNGRFLACFTASGILTVMSTSFTTKVLDFDTSTASKPLQMQWCGEDSLILYWKNFLLMVGPYGHWLKFTYMVPLYLVPEVDCCRIVTSRTCELLQRVPGSIESIHRIGSTDPSAMLYDAMEAFEDGDAKADGNVRSMDPAGILSIAIQANISAAAAEILPSQQKLNLHAAAYGKGFCSVSNFNAGSFVATARKLRVLNHLRRRTPAICLTSAQYDRLAPTTLIDRLLARNHHMLALCISEYLGFHRARVIVHWACAKLRSSKTYTTRDEAMANLLRTRLPNCSKSYAKIAAFADFVGRRRLATMLLDCEFHAIEQVKLLLTMQEFGLALEKAANAMEVDIIYLSLLSMERTQHQATGTELNENLNSHFRIILEHPDATNLLRVYYQSCVSQKSRKQFHNFLVCNLTNLGLHHAGNLAVGQCYLQNNCSGRFEKLREALSLYAQARELQFQLKSTEEQIELLKLQSDLELKFRVTCFFDMSLSETLYNLIALGSTQHSHATALLLDANRIQKRFKVPDRRFSHIKVKALAASGQWHALRIFASEKKSTIGYSPFVRVCVQHGQPVSEVEYYMSRVATVEERSSLHAELGL